MKGLLCMLVITKREYAEEYSDFFSRYGVQGVTGVLCNGTAQESTLSLLGLEKAEKIMFKAMVREENLSKIIRGLRREMDITSAGNGFAVCIPVDSIGGASSLRYLIGDDPITTEENKEDKQMRLAENKTSMIVVIVDKGNTELVMDAARQAGASGGTSVRAKGTGTEIAKFFGISISEEKEMVYILARRDERDAIMKAIMDRAGHQTEAHGVLFSLPIECVVGLSGFEDFD